MKMRIYLNNDEFVSGTTMKDPTLPEANNMALHICQNPTDIVSNRTKLAHLLEVPLDHFVCANQTHIDHFRKVTCADKGLGTLQVETAIHDTDALYTYEPDLVLCSFTADCVPVIFYNEVTGITGVIHSGWQGTVKEITSKLFEHLITVEQCRPDDFHVQIGPALSQEKFEVDEDVYLKFKNLGYVDRFIHYNTHTGKYHIDNQQIVKAQCERAGILTEQISIDQTCTFTSPDGFSYREDKNSGRHLSFIMRKSKK